jgi:hypothetical protein
MYNQCLRQVSLIMICFFISLGFSYGQVIYDYKTKTSNNEKDRTMILDVIRASMYQTHRQEFIFVVNKLNVTSTNAWFEGEVQRKDGKKVAVSEFDDCCHVESLLKRSGGKWYIMELNAFSTDVWYQDIWKRYRLPEQLFLR